MGRDRTSLIAGLYKIYFLGISKSDAWEQMKESGFRTPVVLHGLKAYFDKHASSPPPLAASNPTLLRAAMPRGGHWEDCELSARPARTLTGSLFG